MIIFRYLAKEIYTTLLATSVILLLVFISNQFIRYLKYAAEGRLTAHTVLLVMSLKIPVLLAVMLPLALFLSVLLVYGRLYADNEMTVMFACGVSRARLLRITMMFAAVVAIVVAILMLWVGPHFNKYADTLLSKGAISPLELIQPAKFQSIKNGRWVFYVKQVSSDHKQLKNIFAAEHPEAGRDGKRSLGVVTAQLGNEMIDKKTGDTFLVLHHGHRYVGAPGRKDYQIINFDQYGVRVQSAQERKLKADSISTTALLHDHRNDLSAAELQWRLSIPIMVLILTMMALPLSKARTRQARYIQLVPAMLIYISYGNLIFLARTWMRDGEIVRWLGIWWVHVLMLMIAIVLLMREFGLKRMLLLYKS